MLSPDGRCKPFDIDGRGYVRSEAATAVLLQKAKNSNRIYGSLVHMKTNSDGYTDQGITFPNGESQYELFKEIYEESGVNPAEVEYLEAHGTGKILFFSTSFCILILPSSNLTLHNMYATV